MLTRVGVATKTDLLPWRVSEQVPHLLGKAGVATETDLLPWRVSEQVPHLLGKAGNWQVYQRFRRGLLLANGSRMVFIGTDQTSPGPFHIQVAWLVLESLRCFDGSVRTDIDGNLLFGDQRLCVSRSPLYSTASRGLDQAGRELLTAELSEFLAGTEKLNGFGTAFSPEALTCLPLALACSPQGPACPPQALACLPLALASRRADNLGSFVHQLVGRGQGLTPSGDDFLIGMLAAWPDPTFQQTVCAQALAPGATNRVSQAYYRAALSGHFDETICLLQAAAGSADRGLLQRLFIRIQRFGHSSGRDLLTGLLYGLRVADIQD